MSRQRDILDELVSVSAECFARCISIVHPDFIGLREIDGLARISSETRDRVDHLAHAQVYDFNRPLVLAGHEQALASYVHCHVVEVALNIRQREDRKSTRLNSSHVAISYAVFCLKKKKQCNTIVCS